jgi:hypothetical protein
VSLLLTVSPSCSVGTMKYLPSSCATSAKVPQNSFGSQ